MNVCCNCILWWAEIDAIAKGKLFNCSFVNFYAAVVQPDYHRDYQFYFSATAVAIVVHGVAVGWLSDGLQKWSGYVRTFYFVSFLSMRMRNRFVQMWIIWNRASDMILVWVQIKSNSIQISSRSLILCVQGWIRHQHDHHLLFIISILFIFCVQCLLRQFLKMNKVCEQIRSSTAQWQRDVRTLLLATASVVDDRQTA